MKVIFVIKNIYDKIIFTYIKSKIKIVCNYKCNTCNGSSDNCLTCSDINRDNEPTCNCVSTYYNDGTNQECVSCVYPCLNCTGSSVCTSCVTTENRKLPAFNCVCESSYTDNGSSCICKY